MRPIATIPVSNALKRKLHDAGFYFIEDLSTQQCQANPWLKEALLVLRSCSPSVHFRSALEEWEIESSNPAIVTFSRALDAALGTNGVKLGSITELCGLPGSGKTQICLQLCADVYIPTVLAGLQGESLYIDTNTNFTLPRLEEIVGACVLRCQKLLINASQRKSIECSKASALKSIHYIQCIGSAQITSVLHNLAKFIEEHPKLRLIVIDSIVFPFKDGCPELQRTGVLYRMMATLQKIASEKMIAIVLTNEMTTRIGLAGEQVVAGLGDAWSHRCNVRVLLSKPVNATKEGERRAVIYKSIWTPQACVSFQITKDGIRDME